MGRESRRRRAQLAQNEESGIDAKAALESFVTRIGGGPLGLAHYRPEPDALAGRSFENVWRTIDRHGGEPLYGWIFYERRHVELGSYLFATHHAVWHALDGSVVDVTPIHPDEATPPLTSDGNVVFLVDTAASPVVLKGGVAPRPLQFSAMGASPALRQYVETLQRNEDLRCDELYRSLEQR